MDTFTPLLWPPIILLWSLEQNTAHPGTMCHSSLPPLPPACRSGTDQRARWEMRNSIRAQGPAYPDACTCRSLSHTIQHANFRVHYHQLSAPTSRLRVVGTLGRQPGSLWRMGLLVGGRGEGAGAWLAIPGRPPGRHPIEAGQALLAVVPSGVVCAALGYITRGVTSSFFYGLPGSSTDNLEAKLKHTNQCKMLK